MGGKLSRKERDSQRRRQEIIAAAEYLFSQKGFFKTTMAEIAQQAEFALATIYQFFESKEKLYFTMIEEKGNQLLSLQQQNITQAAGSSDKIVAAVKTILGFFETHRAFFKIYISERNCFEWTIKDELGEQVHQIYLNHLCLLAEIINEGIKEGVFQDKNPLQLAAALSGMVNAFIFQWIISPTEYSLAGQTTTIIELFFHGAQRRD